MSQHEHPLPPPDPNYCSCCREKIYGGSQNVVVVEHVPEAITMPNGELMVKENINGPQAFFHAACFPVHLGHEDSLECKFCGVFKKARNLQTEKGLVDIEKWCKCRCHAGMQWECSMIQIYEADEKAQGNDKTFEKWKRSQENK